MGRVPDTGNRLCKGFAAWCIQGQQRRLCGLNVGDEVAAVRTLHDTDGSKMGFPRGLRSAKRV